MLKKYLEKRQRERVKRMEDKVSSLSDKELKIWFQHADLNNETNLLHVIYEELSNRGFTHMRDF
ncbi:hypothetical protein [Cytobacillus purgationiresistens]|uniref:Fur-regulated basic protein A n=1 Tax=Cytobacillus purgationiresistens TaxID=863449 RepID=A0ABU0AFC7_9BACI|nr:hypothetical protein [Cytobacillus purgationiresistens]MDQ0269968.1 hypothetical protein [Cytobacillus purgationiresistens]